MAGGQLYEGNKFQTSLTESARGRIDVSNLANRGVQEQLDQKKQEALTIYEQGLKLSAAQSMDEAYNQYQNDPENLAAQLNKISEKMTSEIPDQATKIAFRTNFITQSGTLINKAQANYDKIQYQKKKSSYFDTIQANNKSIATALSNAFNGTGSPDDLVNYQTSIKQNIGLINARNEDGTYMFTDAQRLSMSNAVDKLAAESFSAALSDMDDDKRNQVIKAIENDGMILLQGEVDGEVKQLNLKDAFTPEVYADMKKSAKIIDNKIKKQQLAEYDFNKRYSAMMVATEGGEQNYKIWEYYHKDASNDKKKEMQKIAGFVPDEKTVTNFEGISDFVDAIKELSKYNVEVNTDVNEFYNKAIDYVKAAQKANLEKDEHNKPKISSEDLTKQMNNLFQVAANKNIRNLVAKMPDGNWFEKMKAITETSTIENLSGGNIFHKDDKAAGEISRIGLDTMVKMVNLSFAPLKDGETYDERERKIWKTYRDGKEQAILAKYWYIPDIQRGLIDGKIYEINGRFYRYTGELSDNSWELVQ